MFNTTPFKLQSPPTSRPIKLRNLLNGEQSCDNLHTKYKHNNKSHACNELRCLGSIMNPKPVEYKVRPTSETLEHAKDFINNYYASIKRLDSPAHKQRLSEIEEQLKTTDTYYLKETELIYGAKLAWRNASRCIGRIQWSKLQVFDARFTTNVNEMFEALCNHIKYATNKGSLRSAITILPPRVKSTSNDWRIWNGQLISYAGYKNRETGVVIGDPANVEMTEVCQKLGWQGKGTRFDILPLVLSAAGGPPTMFPLPEDIVLSVKIRHPKYKWFEELGLEWYALPAVANMMLDVGGLQFTAAPFSGWYMVTEIGTRDLGDTNRYNVLEEVATKMGLNTTSNMTLWKDQAICELNIAVLDSFQQANVTIVDHHTASETFMTHLANEQRLRGGCPADWVWLVPPTGGSTTQVFHQEMVNYHLLPNYEYQEPMYKTYDWQIWEKLQQQQQLKLQEQMMKKRTSLAGTLSDGGLMNSPIAQLTPLSGRASISIGSNSSVVPTTATGELTPRKLRFKEIARAVKFTSKLFGKALSRRIKATILYATETGKSERFANKLAQTFSCAFNVHLMSMSDYDMTCLEHEALLLIVTSTFGNGDPPENGELFAKHLAAVKLTGDTSPDIDSINSVSTNPFFQMLSEDHKDSSGSGSAGANSGFNVNVRSDNENDESSHSNKREPSSATSVNSLKAKQEQQTNIRPLSNVRFGVFALGSTSYPHFCAFGRYVDQTLGELGAERILKCTCGDELCGQEKAFNEWSSQIFKIACDVFCLTDSIGPIEERPELVWSPKDVKFVPVELIGDLSTSTDSNNNNDSIDADSALGKPNEILTSKKTIVRNLVSISGKKIIPFIVKRRYDLHKFIPEENLQTICIDLESDRILTQASGTNSTTISNSNMIMQSLNNLILSPASKQQQLQQGNITFEAGDHVAIYPINKKEMVDKILLRMQQDMVSQRQANSIDIQNGQTQSEKLPYNFDQVYTILVKRENMDLTPATTVTTATGSPLVRNSTNKNSNNTNWIPHDRLPVTSIREALTRYLDLTSPPNQEFLLILSRLTTDLGEKKKLSQMAKNFTIYEEWKNKKVPTLLSVLEEFSTIKFSPTLITQIPLIKPRFYSVSGTTTSLTVGVVRFKTASGELREGICSNYLNTEEINDPKNYIYGYIRSAPAFHMPQDKSIPMILISAGTGLAPFRAFWQQRYADMFNNSDNKKANQESQQFGTNKLLFGRIEMYFGCRNSNYILYKDELDAMYDAGVLSSINIAFSRPIDRDVIDCDNLIKSNPLDFNELRPISKVALIKQARKKMYVQDKLLEFSDDIYRLIMLDGAHVYVCGDVAMADGVYKTLASIFNNSFRANKSAEKCTTGKDLSSADSASDSGLGGDLARTSEDGESVLMNLRNLNRYHEDIFGAKQMS